MVTIVGWEIERHRARAGREPTGGTPLVVHVPHSATAIPPDVRAQLLLDDAGLTAELAAMTDWHTDRLATEAVERAGADAIVFRNTWSRLVVDPERFPDEREVLAARGMGAVYTTTSTLDALRIGDPAVELDLLARFFHPYATALADTVDEVLAAVGRCTLIDLHSYPSVPLPYELDPAAPRPGVCLGTDPFHTPAALVARASEAFGGGPGGVELDTPFAGTYVPGRHYGADRRVSSLMIEIRRDLYLDEPSGIDPAGFDAVADRLARLLRSLAS